MCYSVDDFLQHGGFETHAFPNNPSSYHVLCKKQIFSLAGV